MITFWFDHYFMQLEFFLKRNISFISCLESLRTKIYAWFSLCLPVFRILSWFLGIFQKCFKKKNELMKFNTFDLFELITDVILFNVQIITTLASYWPLILAPRSFYVPYPIHFWIFFISSSKSVHSAYCFLYHSWI